jgi:hypothetical protein
MAAHPPPQPFDLILSFKIYLAMTSSSPTIQQLIDHLQLQPLPFEGGWFAQTYQCRDILSGPSLPARYPSQRALGTAIYYLMTPAQDGFSALHRLRGDEILHFYLGDPIESLLLYADGSCRRVVLGADILNGQVVQLLIPAGTWQGHRVRPGGQYSLIGSSMTPGYDDADFELGSRAQLCQDYPELAPEIEELTRA